MELLQNEIINRSVKDYHTYRCCAMFYVHRDNILRHSKEKYQKLYNYLMNSKQLSYHTGRFFEYSWHIIFTNEDDDVL